VNVSYEAIRKWCRKFGQAYANALRRRRPRSGDTWHLGEVFLTINKERHYLWRAVDQDGNVLAILVQRRRDKKAAKKFFRKLLKGLTYVPRVLITNKLQKLWRRQAGEPAQCGTLSTPLPQQPGGEFPSADPPAGAPYAGV
jgi:transposase-like protein